MPASPYQSMTPLTAISATNSRALIDTSTTRGAWLVHLQLDPSAGGNCYVGDVTVTNAGVGAVHCLTPGSSIDLPVKSSSGIYVCMASGTGTVFVGVFTAS